LGISGGFSTLDIRTEPRLRNRGPVGNLCMTVVTNLHRICASVDTSSTLLLKFLSNCTDSVPGLIA
jgi:hypothetical protein